MKYIGTILSCIFCSILVVFHCNSMSPNDGVGKVYVDSLFSRSSHTYYIKNVIDLQGGEAHIASDCELVFSRKGRIKNGVLVGKNTRIKGGKKILDRVTIKGTWDVPDISTDMFVTLDYTNSLRDVVALSDSLINNTISIKKGRYVVSTDKNNLAGISLKSNTNLIVEGTLRLQPNDQKRSYVILVGHCDNVNISGNGKIIGDKKEHLGTEGEWGMGIYVAWSRHVSISGVSVYNCWGDCICVCKDSKDVQIQDCYLSGGRRQGISIIAVNDIAVRDCTISNVGGTNPEYAIDVEPNSNETVRNVAVENVVVENCKGGFLVYAKAKNATVENVEFRDCKLSASEKYPFRCEGGDSIKLINCSINAESVSYCVLAEDAKGLLLEGNVFLAKKRVFRKISNAIVKNNEFVCLDFFSAYQETYSNIEFVGNTIKGRVEGNLENSTFERNSMKGKKSILNISSKSNNIQEKTFDSK